MTTLEEQYQASRAKDAEIRHKKEAKCQAEEEKKAAEYNVKISNEIDRLNKLLPAATAKAAQEGQWEKICIPILLPEAVSKEWASRWQVGDQELMIRRDRVSSGGRHYNFKFYKPGTLLELPRSDRDRDGIAIGYGFYYDLVYQTMTMSRWARFRHRITE